MIFRRTSAETDGEAVMLETIVEPDGFVAAAHVHPRQTERFEVLEGDLGLKVGGDQLVAQPGDTVTVRPGTPHRFHNAGDQPVRFVMEIRPALGFESLIETMFTLAAEGKTNRKGLPNLLSLAVIAKAHFDTVRLPRIPVFMQKAGLVVERCSADSAATKQRMGRSRAPGHSPQPERHDRANRSGSRWSQ